MFKKLVSSILMLSLMFCLNPFNEISADQFVDVDNTVVSSQFSMSHVVARDSFFKTLVETSKITKAGDTKLGRFYVRNNTRDGFELSIDSLKGGVLQPTGISADQEDGEVPIPYDIEITKEGDIGVGIEETYEISSAALASAMADKTTLEGLYNGTGLPGVTVLKIAGGGDYTSTASSATDAKFELIVNIEDDSNVMEMAGTYTDVLTLTYRDW
jgi:hypothetical protein